MGVQSGQRLPRRLDRRGGAVHCRRPLGAVGGPGAGVRGLRPRRPVGVLPAGGAVRSGRRRGGRVGGAVVLSERALPRGLVAHLPAHGTLVVSSSMPVRDVEAFAAPGADGPRVLANRGANGIDGVVSTALGVALASGRPTVAVVGDLAFLHDVSALVTVAGFSASLTVVVADNAGGGIFNFLPPATALDPGTFETLFATPQAAGVEAVAAGFGWPVEVTGPERSLEDALDRALARRGLGVIRVPLPARAENVAIHARINAEVVAAVDAGPS